MDTKINLCHPDEKKSCSACCGLLNHADISRQSLTHYLEDGKFRAENYWRYEIDGSYPEQTVKCRDHDTHICPFNGFVSTGSPGCLVHPLYAGEEQRDRALFGALACDHYSCPALTIFSDEIKQILIDSINDWYLYTIAIIDPVSTVWIIEQIFAAGFEYTSSDFADLLQMILESHAMTLGEHEGPVFCYSMEEYEFEMGYYSLAVESEKSHRERKQVLQSIKRYKGIR